MKADVEHILKTKKDAALSKKVYLACFNANASELKSLKPECFPVSQ
jgi:hypothetical protein